MNCDQFQQRLDVILDARTDPSTDPKLVDHAEGCDRCKSQLGLWNQINDAFSVLRDESNGAGVQRPQTHDSRSSRARKFARRISGVMAASAAAVLFFAGVLPTSPGTRYVLTDTPVASIPDSGLSTSDRSKQNRSQAAVSASDSLTEIIPDDLLSDPWWDAMRGDQWVSQTIPAVDSVRIGVAPIGRSMKQAIAILMSHPESPPANTSTLPASESDVSLPLEQTTSRRSGPESLLAIS